jgi:hypothetical protein
MSNWIPLLKEFIWPVFWAIVLLSARRPLGHLLTAIQERIVAGAEFEAGATGIKVGAVPKLAEVQSTAPKPQQLSETSASQQLAQRKPATTLKPSPIYLVHTARRDKRLDQGELTYYRVRIYLDADEPSLLDEVSEITYYLHETFLEPIRTVRDRQTSFEVRTIVWGEFNVAAAVRFKDGHEIKLERYLNL